MGPVPNRVIDAKNFPAGLGVMVVDDDLLCLKVVEKMLKTCKYRGAGRRPSRSARWGVERVDARDGGRYTRRAR